MSRRLSPLSYGPSSEDGRLNPSDREVKVCDIAEIPPHDSTMQCDPRADRSPEGSTDVAFVRWVEVVTAATSQHLLEDFVSQRLFAHT